MAFTTTEKITDTFESITLVGSTFEAVVNLQGRQSDYMAFYFDYVQDASAQLQFGFETSDEDDVFYKETVVDSSTSTPFEPIHSAGGKYRIIIPTYKASDKLKILITPDNITGIDTLVIHADNSYNSNY